MSKYVEGEWGWVLKEVPKYRRLGCMGIILCVGD